MDVMATHPMGPDKTILIVTWEVIWTKVLKQSKENAGFELEPFGPLDRCSFVTLASSTSDTEMSCSKGEQGLLFLLHSSLGCLNFGMGMMHQCHRITFLV